MKYDIILADPPWSYYGQQAKWGAAAKFYSTMTLDEIKSLPIPSLLSPRGILFLWVTCPRMAAGIQCLTSWGLTFRGIQFVWVKTRRDGYPIGAQGVRPSIVKPTTEMVIAGSRVVKGRPLVLHDEGVRQVVLAPKREHSRKPDEVSASIERMYPKAKKLEMFSREARIGWDAHGDEVDKFTRREGFINEIARANRKA